ncbi:MAG: RNase adapter RapZ [Caldisericia bacterium]|nr:RNase adapter RapZ [Caldisericia bacterium]
MNKTKDFVIITGISGAGKTKASEFLEDIGYFCIENLPLNLIEKCIEMFKKGATQIKRVSITLDIRESEFEKSFPIILEKLKKDGVNPFIIFLDADLDTLIKRYKETRRKHPLHSEEGLLSSIKIEKEKLSIIKNLSDVIIDTTDMTLSDLKVKLIDTLKEIKESIMSITIITFGYKYGIPIDSDLIFDVRFLPNPFYLDKLKNTSGLDDEVKNFVLSHEITKGFISKFKDLILFLIPEYIKEGKTSLIISFGCTGGKHRSVVIGEEVKRILENYGYKSTIFHRDIRKE